MNSSFAQIFNILNGWQNNTVVWAVFLFVCLLVLILRIVVCAGYQTQMTLFQFNAKDIASRSDIKDTGSGLLNKIVKDYIKTGEKGIGNVDAGAIVKKHVRRLAFFGWSFNGIEYFVSGFAQGMPLIGILLAIVFPDFQMVYAISTIAVFILMRFMESVFDFRLVKEKLAEELTEYVNREIGQFYGGDISSTVLRLKNELSGAVLQQSETISKSIGKMGDDLSGVLRLNIQEMSKSVETAVSSLSDMSGVMQEPMSMWSQTIREAAQVQKEMNDAFEKLSVIAKELNLNNDLQMTVFESVRKQLDYIEKNQTMLEENLTHYEESLERITQKMGDGFGGLVEYHIQNTYQTVNDNLQENIRLIINSNHEMLVKLQALFEGLQELIKSETQAVLRIKGQIESYFER